MDDCDLCQGSGVCPRCEGTGYPDDVDDVCPVCAGGRWCPNCSGSGTAAA